MRKELSYQDAYNRTFSKSLHKFNEFIVSLILSKNSSHGGLANKNKNTGHWINFDTKDLNQTLM